MKKLRNPSQNNILSLCRKNLSLSLLVVFCVLLVITLVYHFYSLTLNFNKPLPLADFASKDSVSFYVVGDGEKVPITSESVDGQTVLEADSPIYCEMKLEFTFEEAVLDLSCVKYPAAVFLDDKLLFSNADIKGTPDNIKFSGEARISSGDTLITLPDDYEGKTLKLVFEPKDGSVVLPNMKISSIKTIFGQESAKVVDGIIRAVYSLISVMVAVCIFLVGKAMGKTDISVLILIFYFAVYTMIPVNLDYSVLSSGTKTVLQEYRVGEFMAGIATVLMLVFLTLKAKKCRKVIASATVIYAVLVFVFYSVACCFGADAVDKVMSGAYVIYYVQVLLMLTVGVIEMRAGSFFYKYYTTLAIIGTLGLVLWCARLYGADWFSHTNIIAFLSATKRAYLQPYVSLCCVIIAVIEFVAETIRTATYMNALKMQNQLTAEYIYNLNDTVDAVKKTRHEMRHHIETMRIMSENKYYDKLDEYIKQLYADESDLKVLYYSENRIVSAVISSKLRDSQKKQIKTDISVNIPENLNINRKTFASFLMNLLENAVEACERVPQQQGRWIRLKISVKNNKVIIACANSSSGQTHKLSGKFVTSKEDSDKHGLGISIMQQCCESVGGTMIIEHDDSSFTVRAVFPLENQSSEEK